jgi:L-ascorbate metabolism protein UlaG (beta-lactamase superfamily)
MKIKDVQLDYLGHSGFLISTASEKRIAIDPYMISDLPFKADIILITHSHYDHCSIKDITALAREGTTIFIPADAQSKITRIEKINMQIIEAGDQAVIGNIKIEAIPAYNLKKSFHQKEDDWLGYIVKIGDVIIYHAGDTDKIPEMEKLTGYGKQGNEFIILLPVSGNFVMDADEAVEVAKMLKPTLAIPMHFGAGVAGAYEDAQRFALLCQKAGIKAQILEKI